MWGHVLDCVYIDKSCANKLSIHPKSNLLSIKKKSRQILNLVHTISFGLTHNESICEVPESKDKKSNRLQFSPFFLGNYDYSFKSNWTLPPKGSEQSIFSPSVLLSLAIRPWLKSKDSLQKNKKIDHNPSFLLAFPLLGNLNPLRFEAFESEAKTHLSPSSSLIFSLWAIGSHRKRTKLTLFPPSLSSSLTLSGLSRLRRYSLKSKWTRKDQNNSYDRIEVNPSLPPL